MQSLKHVITQSLVWSAGWGHWRRSVVAALSIALLLAAWASPLLAGMPGKIGLLDMKRLEQESLAAQAGAKTLETEQAKEQDDLKALDQEAETLRQAMSTLSPEERKAKEKALKEKLEGVERRKAERPKKRQGMQQNLARDFRNKVKEAVKAYAKEEGLAAVFLKGKGMFYADDSLDITGAILERLNKPAGSSAGGGGPAPKP